LVLNVPGLIEGQYVFTALASNPFGVNATRNFTVTVLADGDTSVPVLTLQSSYKSKVFNPSRSLTLTSNYTYTASPVSLSYQWSSLSISLNQSNLNSPSTSPNLALKPNALAQCSFYTFAFEVNATRPGGKSLVARQTIDIRTSCPPSGDLPSLNPPFGTLGPDTMFTIVAKNLGEGFTYSFYWTTGDQPNTFNTLGEKLSSSSYATTFSAKTNTTIIFAIKYSSDENGYSPLYTSSATLDQYVIKNYSDSVNKLITVAPDAPVGTILSNLKQALDLVNTDTASGGGANPPSEEEKRQFSTIVAKSFETAFSNVGSDVSSEQKSDAFALVSNIASLGTDAETLTKTIDIAKRLLEASEVDGKATPELVKAIGGMLDAVLAAFKKSASTKRAASDPSSVYDLTTAASNKLLEGVVCDEPSQTLSSTDGPSIFVSYSSGNTLLAETVSSGSTSASFTGISADSTCYNLKQISGPC